MRRRSRKQPSRMARLGLVSLKKLQRLPVLLVLLAALVTSILVPRSALKANPAQDSTPTERFQRVHEVVQKAVADKTVPGAVVLVSENGRIVYEQYAGMAGFGSTRPMQKDSVIWLASMSKPITGVAIMMLVEQGKVRLDDPVSKYIPEFKMPSQVKVPKPGSDTRTIPPPEFNLVPANRPITIKDLITHTSGLLSIGPNSVPEMKPGSTLATVIPHLATVSLDFQPGTKWAYSNVAGIDVLARIVEVASGQAFDRYLRDHIFEPLDMEVTGFGPQKDTRASRMAGIPAQQSRPALREIVAGTTYFSGSAGIWSPMRDYEKFAQMLLNEGQMNGKRLLKPETVRMMARNHTGNLYTGSGSGNGSSGLGFGLTMQVVLSASSAVRVPVGSFGWNGAGGTKFWVMPNQKRVLLMYAANGMVQGEIEKAVTQGDK